MPPSTATESAVIERSELALIVRLPIVPSIVTTPTCAVVVLSTSGRPIAAPAATAPKPPPSASAEMSRPVTASTTMPPPAPWICAPESMCAVCELESVSTATWADTATTPAVPANARPSESSARPAWMKICPPAVMFAFEVRCASVALVRLATRIAAPKPTTPPAAAPARPKKARPSSARTRTLPPATTVASMIAEVPRGTVVVIAVCVTPAPRFALSAIDLFAPLDGPVPVASEIWPSAFPP